MGWRTWAGVAVVVTLAYMSAASRNSGSNRIHQDAAWQRATDQLANEVCDAYQQAQNPDLCARMANEQKPEIRERLKKFQP